MENKKKAMICQPTNGLTDEEIKAVKADAVAFLEANGYEVVNTFFEDFKEANFKNVPMAYLAKSIEALSQVDALYCVKGWHEARGCKFEHDIAEAYGIEVITDADDEYGK